MSQQALAVIVGVHGAAVSQWERNIYTPRRDMAQRLDDELGAGGEVLRAFGYADSAVTLLVGGLTSEQRAAMSELVVQSVTRLAARVTAQGVELARLSALLDQRLPASQATTK